MTGDALIDGFGAVGRRSGSFNPKPVTSRLPVILPERSSIQSNVQFLRTKASLVKEDCSWGHDLVLLAKQLAARRTDFDLPTNLQMNYWIHIRMSGRCGRGGETPLPLCRFRRSSGFQGLDELATVRDTEAGYVVPARSGGEAAVGAEGQQ